MDRGSRVAVLKQPGTDEYEVLRTPESRFAEIHDYPWKPENFEVGPGLRRPMSTSGRRTPVKLSCFFTVSPCGGISIAR